MAQPNIRISPLAQGDLKALKTALQKDFGIKANNEEIASALIHGTSAPQLAGMLLAYNCEQAEMEKASE